jgi:hypothetical protein
VPSAPPYTITVYMRVCMPVYIDIDIHSFYTHTQDEFENEIKHGVDGAIHTHTG